MSRRVLLLGNLTVDHNLTESGRFTGPGGSVYFAAKTFENLGMKPVLVSPYGSDFPKHYLMNASFHPQKPNVCQTLVFRNIYHALCGREQWVENIRQARFESIESIPKSLTSNVSIFFVAPIIDNLTFNLIDKFQKLSPKSLKILLPQGFFRQIKKKGQVGAKNWSKCQEIISFFDIIVVSEKDWGEITTCAKKWSREGKIVVVTRAEKGCEVYKSGKKIHVPAFIVDDIVDSTGAGDVYAAAFGFSFLRNHDIVTSAVFANAAAGFSLRFLSNQLQYTYRDIIAFAKSQGREILL